MDIFGIQEKDDNLLEEAEKLIFEEGDEKDDWWSDILEEDEDVDADSLREAEEFISTLEDEDILSLDANEDVDLEDISSENAYEALESHIKSDWLAIDFAALGEKVCPHKYPKAFIEEWSFNKVDILLDLYGSYDKNVFSHVDDILERASEIAKRARKIAILYLQNQSAQTRPAAAKIAESVFADDREHAMQKATKLMIAHEALAHLVGKSTPAVRNAVKIIARYFKQT